MSKAPTKSEVVSVLKQWEAAGFPSIADLARQLGRPRRTVHDVFHVFAPRYKIKIPVKVVALGDTVTQPAQADRIRLLEKLLTAQRKETLDDQYVKSQILKLSDAAADAVPPSWVVKNTVHAKSPGTPCLFASDWHWGERVFLKQTYGLNEYNMEVAHDRAHALVTNTIDLLENHMVNPDYPGIIFILGGDMVSGGIHEELLATDEMEIMPVVLDLFGVLCWCVKTLADKFGKVLVPCVTGNHGRSTKKIRAKGRNFTSYDWLLYQFLARHFANDKRVTFMIPDGTDCAFTVHNHRYLLTHGDQARGGDGVIGMLGPVIRMDHRKRSRASQIDQGYDTMLLGHFHQLTQLRRLIINGSLKGYDEYAAANNFGYEPPQQGLWITHPQHGITFSMPVYVSPQAKRTSRK